jgi:hypothetical protein
MTVCDRIRELAPEFALGALSGNERAEIVTHLAECPACETMVADLAGLADNLLLLSPEVEPPAGFESAVLARIDAGAGATRPPDPAPLPPVAAARRPARWRLLALAAAVIVLGGTAGGLVLRERASHTALTREYVDSLAALGGTELRAAPLVGADGHAWGQAFVYQGKTSWFFVDVQWDLANGPYTVDLQRQNGQSLDVGGLRLIDGDGSMGRSVGNTADVTAVRIVDARGHTMCTARLPT